MSSKKSIWQNPAYAAKLRHLLEMELQELVLLNQIENDAQAPARRYQRPVDQEFAAFICAVIAYGRISQIKMSIRRVLTPMGAEPVRWLLNAKPADLKNLSRGWVHRFNTADDLLDLLRFLQKAYGRYGSLEALVAAVETDSAGDIIERLIDRLTISNSENLNLKKSFWFFLPRPSKGGACKRLNLYLRWMVGSGPTDFGLWKSFPKSKLIIPVDVHVLRQAQKLKLTQRKTGDWKTAEEITASLRYLDPDDPTRFDFPLCHIGVRGKEIRLKDILKSK